MQIEHEDDRPQLPLRQCLGQLIAAMRVVASALEHFEPYLSPPFAPETSTRTITPTPGPAMPSACRRILEAARAAGPGPHSGRKLAPLAKYKYNSHSRSLVSWLTSKGFLRSTTEGYEAETEIAQR